MCDHEFETLVMKEGERISCAGCGSDSVERNFVSLFSCTSVNLTKQLKMDSEERMKKGMKWMKNQEHRKSRIKIM
jgi:hypothetical protein